MAKKKSTGKPKQASGGARLKAAGKVAVLLGLRPDQAATLRAAAEKDGRPLTQFLVFHGLAAAEKILK
jgi:uncharacterized protein (DUF1778 family)